VLMLLQAVIFVSRPSVLIVCAQTLNNACNAIFQIGRDGAGKRFPTSASATSNIFTRSAGSNVCPSAPGFRVWLESSADPMKQAILTLRSCADPPACQSIGAPDLCGALPILVSTVFICARFKLRASQVRADWSVVRRWAVRRGNSAVSGLHRALQPCNRILVAVQFLLDWPCSVRSSLAPFAFSVRRSTRRRLGTNSLRAFTNTLVNAPSIPADSDLGLR
jgi:hypothetical protein